MASGSEDGSDGSDGVQDEEVEAAAEAEYAKVEEVLEVAEGEEGEEDEEDFVTDEEWDAVRAHLAEQDAQKRERASLAERKRQMKEKKKNKSKADAKGARAPLKRSGYRIPKRPLREVHSEVLEALQKVRAEKDAMRAQWDSLTAGKPKALPAGRRVRFRL